MEPSSLKVAMQGLILAFIFLVLALFTAEFYMDFVSEDIIEECTNNKAIDSLVCFRESLFTWPYRQLLFIFSSSISFVLSIGFGFLFTKQYIKNKYKNLFLLAFSASFYRVGLTVLDSSFEVLDIIYFFIVALIIFSGLLLGRNVRSRVFNKIG